MSRLLALQDAFGLFRRFLNGGHVATPPGLQSLENSFVWVAALKRHMKELRILLVAREIIYANNN